MKALDTNLVVRLLIGDDRAQADLVMNIIKQPVWISLTVLQETAWVATKLTGLSKTELADLLDRLLDIETINVPSMSLLRWAIGRVREGAGFADMLHLIDAADLDGFLTFDRRLARQAGESPPLPIETLAA